MGISGQGNLLRLYRAPNGHEAEVQRLLSEVSYPVPSSGKEGRSTIFINLRPKFTGGGYFVLSAPKSIQEGVKELLKVLATTPPKAPRSTVQGDYWVVVGHPATEGEVAIPAKLEEVKKALQPLLGLVPMRFTLLEKFQLTAVEGKRSTVVGRHGEVRQSTVVGQDGLELDLNIKVDQASGGTRGNLMTQVKLQPGQFAVLGQTGLKPAKNQDASHEEEATLFYIARLNLVN